MSRFRMYPTRGQEVLLLDACGQARYVWNLALEQALMWARWKGPTPGLAEQMRQLTEARAAFPWLAAGYGNWSSVLVPKVGWVRFKRSRAVPKAKSYRVTRDRAGRWHIAFAAVPDPIPAPGTGEVVGVDRGVTAAVTLSTGEMTSPAGLRPKERERLLRLRRKLARARRGSHRRAKLKNQIARITAREADRRKDWIEKITTDLASRFDLIRVEDLDVKGMTRSARGTRETPGRNVRAKAGLNREILARGWAQLVTRLEHKAAGRVERVDPAYTSQTCNACGHVAAESRKSQSRFVCVACGHQANADVNAACNTADRQPAAGRAVAARGDRISKRRSVKREPQRTPPLVA